MTHSGMGLRRKLKLGTHVHVVRLSRAGSHRKPLKLFRLLELEKPHFHYWTVHNGIATACQFVELASITAQCPATWEMGTGVLQAASFYRCN